MALRNCAMTKMRWRIARTYGVPGICDLGKFGIRSDGVLRSSFDVLENDENGHVCHEVEERLSVSAGHPMDFVETHSISS